MLRGVQVSLISASDSSNLLSCERSELCGLTKIAKLTKHQQEQLRPEECERSERSERSERAKIAKGKMRKLGVLRRHNRYTSMRGRPLAHPGSFWPAAAEGWRKLTSDSENHGFFESERVQSCYLKKEIENF